MDAPPTDPNYPTLDAADHRCENGATGLVVSSEHSAESDVVAPCTATAWMGMKLSVAEDSIDPLDSIAPSPLGGILLGLVMSHDSF